MKKSLIVVGVVVGIIILSAVGWFVFGSGESDVDSEGVGAESGSAGGESVAPVENNDADDVADVQNPLRIEIEDKFYEGWIADSPECLEEDKCPEFLRCLSRKVIDTLTDEDVKIILEYITPEYDALSAVDDYIEYRENDTDRIFADNMDGCRDEVGLESL